jgi:hypothetical protein
MRLVTALALALWALSGCWRPERPSPRTPRRADAPRSAQRTDAFCLVEMAKHDGPAQSVWLAWRDASEEWRHERVFGLKAGADARRAVVRAVPRTTHWLLLCDPGGLETDDFVHVGLVTGTESAPMPVVFAARNGKIRLLDEPE